MTQAEIEKTLDQLVRRARYFDAMQAWLVEHWPRPEVDEESARLRAVHGVVPFEEPPPAPQPATEGDGKPEDAPADRTRLTLYPSRMCEATRAAFDWIKSHDGGAHGALFTRALSDACAEYAAHLTASLRAEVEVQRIMANGNFDGWQKVEKERDELRAEVERLKKEVELRTSQWKFATSAGVKAFKELKKLRKKKTPANTGPGGYIGEALASIGEQKPARRPARGKGKGVKRGK